MHRSRVFVATILLLMFMVFVLYSHVLHQEILNAVNNSNETLQLKVSGIDNNLHKTDGQNYTLVHEHRIRRIQTVCKDGDLFANRTYLGSSSLKYLYMYSEKYNFAYCKVRKSGCTLWTQAFLLLNNRTVEETFGMKRFTVHAIGSAYSISSDDLEVKNPRMVLVSRDPYTRLYSAYVDKIYLGILPAYRSVIGRNDTVCNFNITFEQFLQYIIKTSRDNKALDIHWAPIFSVCNPCKVNQYRLVKQETFSQDVELVLKELNVEDSKYKVITDALHAQRAEATIPGIVGSAYLMNTRLDVAQCIGFSGVARRLWKSFQIQGFIDKNIDFPDHEYKNEKEYSNSQKLIQIILDCIKEHPLTQNERLAQRREAVVSAYKYVSKNSIEGIREVYRPDFQLFDYDDNPPK